MAICEGKEPARIPRVVTYYYLCLKFNCLPESGGLKDQDPDLLEAFLLCIQAEKDYEEIRKKKEKAAAEREKRTGKR